VVGVKTTPESWRTSYWSRCVRLLRWRCHPASHGLAHMPSRENTGPMAPAPSPRPAIHGVDVDPHGRCCHYRSSVDVIANRCATCNAWWACYQCHEQCTDHPFGTVSVDADNTILCGVCGITM